MSYVSACILDLFSARRALPLRDYSLFYISIDKEPWHSNHTYSQQRPFAEVRYQLPFSICSREEIVLRFLKAVSFFDWRFPIFQVHLTIIPLVTFHTVLILHEFLYQQFYTHLYGSVSLFIDFEVFHIFLLLVRMTTIIFCDFPLTSAIPRNADIFSET